MEKLKRLYIEIPFTSVKKEDIIKLKNKINEIIDWINTQEIERRNK